MWRSGYAAVCPAQRSGAVAEWLRSGLQNRAHRFNSGQRLQARPLCGIAICHQIKDLFF